MARGALKHQLLAHAAAACRPACASEREVLGRLGRRSCRGCGGAKLRCCAVQCGATPSALHSTALHCLCSPAAGSSVHGRPLACARLPVCSSTRFSDAFSGFRFAALSPSPRFESRLLQLDFIKKAGWGQASPGWGLTPNFGGVSPSAPRAVRCFLFRRLRWGTRAKFGVDCDAGVCTDSSHKQACR